MWTIEQLVDKINDFQNIIYAVGVVFLIIFIFVIYNLISIYYLKKNNNDEHDNQFLSIAMNKHNINMLKRYIDEENKEYDSQMIENKSNIDKNLNKIISNQAKFESTKASFNDSITANKSDISTIKADVLSNNSKISTFNTEFDAYQINQSDIIKSITTNQNSIQSNIATFKYSDFEILRSNVNQNNQSIVNLETNIHSNFESIGDIEEELDVINNKYLPINELPGHLDNYYTTDLLPKFNALDSTILSNKTAFDQSQIDLNNNYMKSTEIEGQFATMTSNLNNNYMRSSEIESNFNFAENKLNNMTSNLTNNYMTSSEIDLRFHEIEEEIL